MTTLPYENPTWVQNGEPVSGGTGGNSDGVLNRPLVQVHANVDAVRDALDPVITEVTTARGGQVNLDTRLDLIDNELAKNVVEATMVNQKQPGIPSGFLMDYAADTLANTTTDLTTSTSNRGTSYSQLMVRTLGSLTSNDANKIFMAYNPKPLFINGRQIILEQRPGKLAHLVINAGTAPATGTRQDFAFIEVWTEKCVYGAADSVLFPYGCVNSEASGTFNGCTLHTADASGGNYPAYLTAGNHGTYVKCNDANINTFIANPDNNVFTAPNGDMLQVRWRIRVAQGANAGITQPHGDTTNVKAQGMLGSASSTAFGGSSTDVGLSIASASGLAYDNAVYAVPVCKAHRRNSTAWSLSNPNGAGAIGAASGRPDGKFYDHIHFDDIVDLRMHISLNNEFDYKRIYDNTISKVLASDLTTNWEHYHSDTDGNNEWKALNIYGTKLLRAEGLAGSTNFEAQWELAWKKTASNGVSTLFDGMRNYYSDIPGDQVVMARIPDIGVDGVLPTTCFDYTASSRTLSFDATDLASNDGSHAQRTKVSTRRPHLKWSDAVAGDASNGMVAGTWNGLGGDTATFVIDAVSSVRLTSSTDCSTVAVDDVYRVDNGGTNVDVTIKDKSSATTGISGTFSGATLPVTGTYTKQSGSGPATITVTAISIGTKFVGTSLTTTVETVGTGSNLHANKAIFVNAYLSFTAGSGWVSRVPYRDNSSVKATHYYLNDGGTMTQVLPGDGVGFIPYGSSVDPVNEGTVFGADSHTKSFGMVAFTRQTEMFSGFAGSSFASHNVILKEGNTYKIWYSALKGVYFTSYIETTDFVNFSNHKNASLPLPADAHTPINFSIIKEGGLYIALVTYYAPGEGYCIYRNTSSTGYDNWGTPVRVLQYSHFPSGGARGNGIRISSLVRDGGTLKFYGVSNIDYNRYVIYAESTDLGVTWSNHLNLTLPDASFNVYSFYAFKDGNTYKAIVWAYASGQYISTYAESLDGKVWTNLSKDAPNVGFPSASQILVDGNRIMAMSGGRLTVYAMTPGSSNFAPPADSQVVMFYEARAVQHVNEAGSSYPKHFTYEMYLCSVGTGKYIPPAANYSAQTLIMPTERNALPSELGDWQYNLQGESVLGNSMDTSSYLSPVPLLQRIEFSSFSHFGAFWGLIPYNTPTNLASSYLYFRNENVSYTNGVPYGALYYNQSTLSDNCSIKPRFDVNLPTQNAIAIHMTVVSSASSSGRIRSFLGYYYLPNPLRPLVCVLDLPGRPILK